MTEFFAGLYEWGGLSPLYATDLGDHLRGYNVYCEYGGTPMYSIIGGVMLLISLLVYAVYYHILDRTTWQRRGHWSMFLLVNFALNFSIAFTIPYNDIAAGNYCSELLLTVRDCLGFALSNGIWAVILFSLVSLSPFPRKLSVNCRNTPWKQ